MTLEELRQLVARVTFPGWEFVVNWLDFDTYSVQARFMAPCNVHGGEPTWQYTRQWLIVGGDTEGSVVGTCLKCVLTAIEHEAREQFKFKGVAVFNPHTSIAGLAALQRD